MYRYHNPTRLISKFVFNYLPENWLWMVWMVHIWGVVKGGYETDIGWDTQRADAKCPCEYHAWIIFRLVCLTFVSFLTWFLTIISCRNSSSNYMIVDMLSSVKRQIMKMELDALSMLSSSCLLIQHYVQNMKVARWQSRGYTQAC